LVFLQEVQTRLRSIPQAPDTRYRCTLVGEDGRVISINDLCVIDLRRLPQDVRGLVHPLVTSWQARMIPDP
jgi:hypothetical protein